MINKMKLIHAQILKLIDSLNFQNLKINTN